MPDSNSQSQRARNLRFSSLDAIMATPWSLLSLPGSFLAAGFLNTLFNVGPVWFGLITAMPALANALQIFLVPVTARFLHVRDLTLSMGWLNAGLWLSGIVGMAFLPLDTPDQSGLFFTILFLLASVSMSMMALGWMTWVTDFVPVRIRGRYFGRRNRLANISTLGFILTSLALLGISGASRGSYLALCGLAVFLRVASMMVQHLIISPTPGGGSLGSANWARDITGLRRNRQLVRFILFGALTGFWLGSLGTIGPLYALGPLGVSPAMFTGLALVSTVTGAMFIRIWGELIDRHGAAPVVVICMTSWRLIDYAWIFLTPSTTHFMYLMWALGGIMGAGYLVASFNLLLKLVPQDRRAAGISLNLTATSVAAALAPILVGFIIYTTTRMGLEIIHTYRVLFGVANTGGLLTVLILWRLPEPQTAPDRNTINGAMRTLRFLTVNQGLSFLSNATFVVRQRKGDNGSNPSK
jgi:hypothetical protein